MKNFCLYTVLILYFLFINTCFGHIGHNGSYICLSCTFRAEHSIDPADELCVSSPVKVPGQRLSNCLHGCMTKSAELSDRGLLSFTRGCMPPGAQPTKLNCTTSYRNIRICEDFCIGDLCNSRMGSSISTPAAPTCLPPPTTSTPSAGSQLVTAAENASATCPQEAVPRNCLEVLRSDRSARTGQYYVYPSGVRVSVWCDMDTAGGGWTVILRRFNGSLEVFRDWDDFKYGFGVIDGGEFWLGNDFIHLLTYQDGHELRIDMADVNGPTFAEWEHFAVADEGNKYKLSVSGFKPTSKIRDSMAYHNNMYFTTKDRDYDRYTGNCAIAYKAGGWWFNNCWESHLTGRYEYVNTKGYINRAMSYMYTSDRSSGALPLRTAFMKIRPFYRPKDCWDILERLPRARSGVYTVYLGAASTHTGTAVYCDMDTDGGGWTVFLRRYDGSIDFYKNYADYEKGIGSVYEEHWMSLKNIHLLSFQRKYELRVDVESKSEARFSQYSRFVVGNSADQYRLHVSGYYPSSTAGDALKIHDQQTFSAKDKITNTQCSGNCAISSTGGWWYNCCHTSNLLGSYDYTSKNQGHVKSYAKSVIWSSFTGLDYSLKTAEMKLRPQLPCRMQGGLKCNGNGDCFNDLTRGQATCHCRPGFSGDNCQFSRQ